MKINKIKHEHDMNTVNKNVFPFAQITFLNKISGIDKINLIKHPIM